MCKGVITFLMSPDVICIPRHFEKASAKNAFTAKKVAKSFIIENVIIYLNTFLIYIYCLWFLANYATLESLLEGKGLGKFFNALTK